MIGEFVKGKCERVSEEYDSIDFDCKCTRVECTKTLIDETLIDALTELSNIFPILLITSGYRCEAHNREVGGKEESEHMLGKAADVKTRFALPKEVAAAAEKIAAFANGGIGIYNSFVHTDVRNGRARW